MAWIEMVPIEKAEGKLKELYKKLRNSYGIVDHILKIHSLNPKSLEGHYEFYKWLMRGKSGLSRAQREMIAVVVSAVNQCHYWMTHHGEALRQLTKDDNLAAQLKKDFRQANLPEKDRAMLEYAEKLTLEPWRMLKQDVEALRQVSFSDADILDINQVAAYFAFVNRLADGLGVELESYWDKKSS